MQRVDHDPSTTEQREVHVQVNPAVLAEFLDPNSSQWLAEFALSRVIRIPGGASTPLHSM